MIGSLTAYVVIMTTLLNLVLAGGIVGIVFAIISDRYLHRRHKIYRRKISTLEAVIKTLEEAKRAMEKRVVEQELSSTRKHDSLAQEIKNLRQELERLTHSLATTSRERGDLIAEVHAQKRQIARRIATIQRFETDPGWALRAVEEQLKKTKAELETKKRLNSQWRVNVQKKEKAKYEEMLDRHLNQTIDYSNERQAAFEARPALEAKVQNSRTTINDLTLKLQGLEIEHSRMRCQLDRVRRERAAAKAELAALRASRSSSPSPKMAKPPRHPGTFTVPDSSESDGDDDDSDDGANPPQTPTAQPIRLPSTFTVPSPSDGASEDDDSDDGTDSLGDLVFDRPGYVPRQDKVYLMSGAIQVPLPPIDDDSPEAPLPEPFLYVEDVAQPRRSVHFADNVQIINMSASSAPAAIQQEQPTEQAMEPLPETERPEQLLPDIDWDYAAELEREMSVDDGGSFGETTSDSTTQQPSPAAEEQSRPLPWLFQEQQMSEFQERLAQSRVEAPPLVATQLVQPQLVPVVEQPTAVLMPAPTAPVEQTTAVEVPMEDAPPAMVEAQAPPPAAPQQPQSPRFFDAIVGDQVPPAMQTPDKTLRRAMEQAAAESKLMRAAMEAEADWAAKAPAVAKAAKEPTQTPTPPSRPSISSLLASASSSYVPRALPEGVDISRMNPSRQRRPAQPAPSPTPAPRTSPPTTRPSPSSRDGTDDRDYLDAETDDSRALRSMSAGNAQYEHRANARNALGQPMITPRSLRRRQQHAAATSPGQQDSSRPAPAEAPSGEAHTTSAASQSTPPTTNAGEEKPAPPTKED